jgi:hypothetical protein
MKFVCMIMMAFAATIAMPAAATEIIDQDGFIPPPGGQPSFGWIGLVTGTRAPPMATAPVNTIVGQTVTAGRAGTLATIDLQYSPTVEGLQLRLYDRDVIGTGPLLNGTYFRGARLGASGIRFDVSGFGYAVQAGRRFSFDLLYLAGFDARAFIGIGTYEAATPPAPPPIRYYADYSGGSAFISSDPFGMAVPIRSDLAFRTSVNPFASSVPEPGTWVMMLAGFGAAGAVVRRKRRRAAAA